MTGEQSTFNRREAVVTGVYFVGWLVALDVIVALLTPLPSDARIRPNPLQQYFSYGLSVEAKIERLLSDQDANAAPITRIGWPRTAEQRNELISTFDAGKPRIAVYGQSYTFHVAKELQELMPVAAISLKGGPAAPLNHAYARYLADRDLVTPDVAIFGIVASSIEAIDSMTHMTRNFEAPCPYTYPQFEWNGDACDRVDPIVNDANQLRLTLTNGEERDAWLTQLATHDGCFSALMYCQSPLDFSTCTRLLRRAWGHHRTRSHRDTIHGPSGFREDSDTVHTARWIVRAFSQDVVHNGGLPIVLLFNNRNFGEDLYRMMSPTLEADGTAYLSTHEIAPTNDRRYFLPDGHLKPKVNRKLADQLREMIGSRRPGNSSQNAQF